MIEVKPLSADEWEVAVHSRSVTTHRVRMSPDDLQRIGGGNTPAETLLEASFRFLLDREPNTSILPAFDLPVIGRYFPEYEREIERYLNAGSR